MANEEHVAILKRGVEAWNQWRRENPDVRPDLRHLNFETIPDVTDYGPDLENINLSYTALQKTSFRNARLYKANLQEADLPFADLCYACFVDSNLSGAVVRVARLGSAVFQNCNLRGADLAYCSAKETSFEGSDLTGANLEYLQAVRANFDRAKVSTCLVYGTASWDLSLDGTIQEDLVITSKDEPKITVDNLELAQFIYLLINNQRLRHVIDSITSKVVLILGRFTTERKKVLDELKETLRKYDLVPVLFDFEKPTSRTFIETVSTLAHMARFIIADFTAQGDVRREVHHIAGLLSTTPIVPLLHCGELKTPLTLIDLSSNPLVLQCVRYSDIEDLKNRLETEVIIAAEAVRSQLIRRLNEEEAG